MMKMQSFCVDSVHNTILWISKKEQSMIQKKKKYQITDKEDATSLPKESFSLLPTKPITHCMQEHSLQESHRLTATREPALLHSWAPLDSSRHAPGFAEHELSPLACPGHRGASRGVPRLASPSFSFALIVLNTTYWASTLCLFLYYVPLPPQILQRVWLNKVKLREHYQSGMVVFVFCFVFCQTKNPNQNGLNKKRYWLT